MNNQRTGSTAGIGPTVPFVSWVFRAGSSLQASPIVLPDGTVYCASTDGRLYAIHRRGQVKWVFACRDSLYSTPAVGPEGTIFLADLDGWYYAVRPDGSEKWSRRLQGGPPERRVTAAVTVAEGGQSYVAAWNGHLYSFGPDGTLLWERSFEGGGPIDSSPALDSNGNLFMATLDPLKPSSIAVFKLDGRTGTDLWKFAENLGANRNRITSSPALDVAGGRLYVGAARDADGCVFAVSLADGKRLFRIDLPRAVVSSPAVAPDGTVYVGSMNGRLYALDPVARAARWEYDTGAYFVMGSPVVDGQGSVYVGDSAGVLHAIAANGQLLWSFATQSNIASSPVIGNSGMLYFTSCDSALYAVRDRHRRMGPPGGLLAKE
jgi:outer membrane protein assembly factor BamB